MAELVFVVLAGIVLTGACFAVVATAPAGGRRALLLVVLALASLVLLVGADLPAWAVLVGGLTGGAVVLAAPRRSREIDTLDPDRRADARVIPGALAAIVFGGLYLVIARGHWTGPIPGAPVALTSLLGAQFLTGDLLVLVLSILVLAGAVAGAARLVARVPREDS